MPEGIFFSPEEIICQRELLGVSSCWHSMEHFYVVQCHRNLPSANGATFSKSSCYILSLVTIFVALTELSMQKSVKKIRCTWNTCSNEIVFTSRMPIDLPSEQKNKYMEAAFPTLADTAMSKEYLNRIFTRDRNWIDNCDNIARFTCSRFHWDSITKFYPTLFQVLQLLYFLYWELVKILLNFL